VPPGREHPNHALARQWLVREPDLHNDHKRQPIAFRRGHHAPAGPGTATSCAAGRCPHRRRDRAPGDVAAGVHSTAARPGPQAGQHLVALAAPRSKAKLRPEVARRGSHASAEAIRLASSRASLTSAMPRERKRAQPPGQSAVRRMRPAGRLGLRSGVRRQRPSGLGGPIVRVASEAADGVRFVDRSAATGTKRSSGNLPATSGPGQKPICGLSPQGGACDRRHETNGSVNRRQVSASIVVSVAPL
jgi:hypothetical protein